MQNNNLFNDWDNTSPILNLLPMIDCSPFHDDEFPPKAAADEFDDELNMFESGASMAHHNLVEEMNQDFSEFTIDED